MTSADGTVTDTYTYDAFGSLTSQSGDTPNTYLYTGEQYDPNAGFYYLRARYYDQAAGRFITADPFQGLQLEPKSLHKYTYANADPVNNIDPNGEFTFSLAGISISINIQGNLRSIHSARGAQTLIRVQKSLSRINVRSVRDLKKLPKIKGNEIHHIIEKRLWKSNPVLKKIFKSIDDIPGVSINRAQHQIFTQAWRRAFPYSNQAKHIARPSLEQIIKVAENIYAGHPQLLKAIFLKLL